MTGTALLLVELVIMLFMIFLVFYLTFEFYKQTTASFAQIQEKFREIQKEALR